jgi:hypothetical protein
MKRLLPELPRIFRRSLKVKSLFMNILAISPLNSKILRSILSKLLIPKIEIKKKFREEYTLQRRFRGETPIKSLFRNILPLSPLKPRI